MHHHHDAETIVALAAIICLFGFPVAAFVAARVMKHRERMAMIERGMVPGEVGAGARDERSARKRRGGDEAESADLTLRRGIKLTAVGFALTLGLSYMGFTTLTDPFGVSVDAWRPGPWLLFGLVPLFIGLARIAIALLSGATLRRVSPPRAEPSFAEKPFVEPPFATYDTSYTYRPDGTRELHKPAPPERR